MDIIIADPHPDVRSALCFAIDQMPGLRVTGEAGDVLELLAQLAHTCPDVILLDPCIAQGIASPRRSAFGRLAEMLHLLRRFCPRARIIVISSQLPVEGIDPSLGLAGLLSKTDPPESLWRVLYAGDDHA